MSDKERVKDKKVKDKKKDKERKLETEEEPAVVAVDAVEEHSEVKKSKKDKKKDRTETPAVEEEVVEEEVAVEKKSKKDKKRKAEVEETEVEDEKPSKKDSKKSKASPSTSASLMYREHPETSALTSAKIQEMQTSWNSHVIPEEIINELKPIAQFDYLRPSLARHCPYVMKYITDKSFSTPTAIQAQCWPALLQGKDIIGIAATGSGKTLAFLIPAMLKIAYMNENNISAGARGIPSPKVLILAPTRELALQSQEVVEAMKGPKGVCIYGGVPKGLQKKDLQAGAEIVVATPGRLLDLLQEGALSLANIRYMVLDEADRMLDEGFAPAINQILGMCPSNETNANPLLARQTVMFSATWPEEIRQLAEKYLHANTIRVVVGSTELAANHRVKQIVECVEAREKDSKLRNLLKTYHSSRTNKILVFVLYKKEAVELSQKIQQWGYNVTAIHGDKAQADRTNSLGDFKSGQIPLLIATDVAARGLDIPQVEYVINYSFPLTVEDYVHRIGRTGRGGATGVSHTFFTDFDKGLAGGLVGVLQEAGQDVPPEIYKYPMITKKKTSKLYGDFGPKADLQGKKATKITFD